MRRKHLILLVTTAIATTWILSFWSTAQQVPASNSDGASQSQPVSSQQKQNVTAEDRQAEFRRLLDQAYLEREQNPNSQDQERSSEPSEPPAIGPIQEVTPHSQEEGSKQTNNGPTRLQNPLPAPGVVTNRIPAEGSTAVPQAQEESQEGQEDGGAAVAPAVPSQVTPSQPARVPAFPGFPGVAPPAGQGAAGGQTGQPGQPGLGAGQQQQQQPGAPGQGLPVPGGQGAEVPAAQEQIPPVEVRFQAMPLEQFLEIYAQLVERTVLRPAVLPNVTITLKAQTPLSRPEAVQAFNSVLALNQITAINVGEKFVKIVQVGQALQEGAAFNQQDPSELPELGKFVTQIVQVQHVVPSELNAALTPFAKNPGGIVPIDSSQVIVLRDYAENVKRMLEVIEQVDVEVPIDVKTEVIPIKYALAEDIAQVIGSLTTGGQVTQVGRSGTTGGGQTFGTGGTTAPGTSGFNQFNQYGGGTSRYGGGYGGSSRYGRGIRRQSENLTITPQQASSSPSANRRNFQDRLRQIVNRAGGGAGLEGQIEIIGNVQVIADRRTNSLLVFASEKDIEMVKEIVDKLDVILAQVLIEGIILEVSLTDSSFLGVSVSQNKAKAGDFRGAGAVNNGQTWLNPNNITSLGTFTTNAGSGFSYFGRLGDTWDVALNAIASDGTVNVLQRPRVQTSHAVPASFFVGETVPYVTATSFGGATFGNYSSYQRLPVGVEMQVTPFINPDGLVVMQISQSIEQLGTPVTIDGNEVPTTTTRYAEAEVAVRNQDTIILGGFISSSKRNSKSGVPVLKDIPLLGALFSSRNDSNERKEMVVLIRPTVLDTPEAAAMTAAQERNRLPGIRQAEEQFRKEEETRIESGDRRSLIR